MAVTGGSSTPSPPTSGGDDLKKWIKKNLDHLSSLLQKLALKAVDAIPGIIGSIVGWLLSTAGKVMGYMANNLWTLFMLVGGMLIVKIKK